MQDEEATTSEGKKSSGLTAIFGWGAAILLAYILSIGPVVMMFDRGFFNARSGSLLERIYAPLVWAYERTPLHRPLGLYLHLWSKRFDLKGDDK